MVGPHQHSKLLTVKSFQWVYVIIFIWIIGPFTFFSLVSHEIFDDYVRTYIAPGIQRRFGFRMERRRMYYRGTQPLNVFVIKNLEPEGALTKLGVQNCDVPLGFYHMSDVTFYWQLEKSKGTPVEIRFLNCDEYQKALMSGDLFLAGRAHKIVLWPRQESFNFWSEQRREPSSLVLEISLRLSPRRFRPKNLTYRRRRQCCASDRR